MQQEAKSLEAMLSVGTKAVVATQPENPDGPRFVVRLRGWQQDKYLVFDCPATEPDDSPINHGRSRRLPIRPKSEVIIRFILEGDVFAFREFVVESLHIHDIPHFTVRWPRKYESMRVRKFERFDVETRCKVVLPNGDAIVATSVDMSKGGCAIRMDRPMEQDVSTSLTITLPDGIRLESILSKVRSLRRDGDDFVVGLQFLSIPEKAERDLDIYFQSLRMHMASEEEEGKNVVFLLTGTESSSFDLSKMSLPDHVLITLTDVVECLYRLRLLRPKAVLIDCTQESWSGLDVCALIRANPYLSTVRLILVGVSNQHIDAAQRILGADMCIPSNVTSVEEIGTKVHGHLTSVTKTSLSDSSLDLAVRAVSR